MKTAPANDAVAAFEKDCAHVFLAKFDDMAEGGEKPECESRDFEQNCAEDIAGCFEAEQKCKDDCSSPCSACQAKCTTGCSDCKTTCATAADKPACIRTCATSREGCRQGCLAGLNTCRDTTCPAQSKACGEAADARRIALCPDCAQIQSFLDTNLYGATSNDEWPKREARAYAAAAKKFPKADKECFKLCTPSP